MTLRRNVLISGGLKLAILLIICTLSYWSTSRLIEASHSVTHTHQVLELIETVLSRMKDAEVGQRGFLLTGREEYLQPFDEAREQLDQTLAEIRSLTADNDAQQRRLETLKPLVEARFQELQETIDLRRNDGSDAALQVVLADKGKVVVDDIRRIFAEMRDTEAYLLRQRAADAEATARLTFLIDSGVGIFLVLLLLAEEYFRRASIREQTKMEEVDERRKGKLRKELSQARKELRQANERIKTLEIICLSTGRQPTGLTPAGREESPAGGEISPGKLVPKRLGYYDLLEKLGQGGMGVVYKARHIHLKRVVALKILPAHLLDNDSAVARFRREVEAVARFDHPNIVRASDAREVEGWHFLVMEMVDGIDLAKLADRAGPLSVADACEIVRQVAMALQHAHQHGLVHRDIKPSNLMMTPTGQVKLLDLGLARLYGDQPVSEVLTATNQMMGTPDYMAPEQAFDSKSVDIRADIYSLGCTLYKLLAGRTPFADVGNDSVAEKLLAHAQTPVPSIREHRPEVSQELAALFDRLLAKRPADRFSTPGEVAMALERFAVGHDLLGTVAPHAPMRVGVTAGEISEAEV